MSSDATGDNSLADAVSDAVEAVEDATLETMGAAMEAGDVDAFERAAAAVVEGMRRSLADVEDVADTVEQIAEEVAENAPEHVAEAAESAVDAAHDAQEAVDEAQEELREELREQGGGEATEDVAVDQAIHEEAEEARESVPVESVPAINADEEVSQMVADVSDSPPPPLMKPETDHPYYRTRKLRMFGREFKL